MTLGDTTRLLRRGALRVFLGCFMGAVIMAIYASMRNHPLQSPTFCAAGAVLALLGACSLLAYFRPRGFPAFITSTAYVELLVVMEGFCDETWMHSFPASWRVVLAWVIPLAWLVKGITKFKAASQNCPAKTTR